jgi:serine/threonine protein kinase
VAILPGKHLGSYEILSSIGASGMGEVYKARDSKLGRDVAVSFTGPTNGDPAAKPTKRLPVNSTSWQTTWLTSPLGWGRKMTLFHCNVRANLTPSQRE